MPQWLITVCLTYLVPIAIAIVKQFGLPALEAKYPQLVPLLQELLALLSPKAGEPTEAIHSAACQYIEKNPKV